MIISTLANVILPYRQLLVGFSGGLDSTVLLHRLKLWRDRDPSIKLRAIHVHHDLSLNADNWAEHCVKICKEWQVSLIVIHVNVIKNGLGIEAYARKVRYEAFEKALLPSEILVTAHHMHDQCETVLLALKRGSGPAGLSAMPVSRKFATTRLFRPLINETQESLKIWAKTNSLHWIEDESNYSDCSDRNFLRLNVIPLLSNRWPYIASSIARSAKLCADQESLIDELLADELKRLISTDGGLAITPMLEMSSTHRAAIIRRWLSNQGALLMPSSSMLNRLWKEVAQARKDAMPLIHLNGYDVRRFNGMLWKTKPQQQYISCYHTILPWCNPYKSLMLPFSIGEIVLLNKGGHILPPSPTKSVSIRFKASGVIHIVGRNGGRKLKKIWQELNIPPWERTMIPLLFYDEILIAAAGKFITQAGWVEKGVYLKHNRTQIL